VVPKVRMILVPAASVTVLALALITAEGSAADGLTCVNATRDWKRSAQSTSLETARAFLRMRVRRECSELRKLVEQRIQTLEQKVRITQASPTAPDPAPKVTPRPSRTKAPPEPQRDARPEEKIAAPQPKPTPSPARLAPPPAGFQYSDTARVRIWQPNWYQVLARYPHLARLQGRGSDDLCAQCVVGGSGYLEQCAIAGAAAADPEIRRGAQTMISMIYIRKLDGGSAVGSTPRIPVWFGERRSPPAGGYCSNPARDFRR
jgi:hypothetical protein